MQSTLYLARDGAGRYLTRKITSYWPCYKQTHRLVDFLTQIGAFHLSRGSTVPSTLMAQSHGRLAEGHMVAILADIWDGTTDTWDSDGQLKTAGIQWWQAVLPIVPIWVSVLCMCLYLLGEVPNFSICTLSSCIVKHLLGKLLFQALYFQLFNITLILFWEGLWYNLNLCSASSSPEKLVHSWERLILLLSAFLTFLQVLSRRKTLWYVNWCCSCSSLI